MQAPLIFWTTDEELRITSAFGGGLAGLAQRPDGLLGRAIADVLGGAGAGAATITAHHRALAGDPTTCEQAWDGRVMQITVEPLRNGRKSIHGVVGIALDVTERKRAEAELARLEGIVQDSDDAIVAIRLDGVITAWNRGAERLYGWTATEAVGRPIGMILPPDGRRELTGLLVRIAGGNHLNRHDAARVRKDGTRIEVSLRVSPIRDHAGRVIGASDVARDTADGKRAERAEQHIEALGTVTALAVAAAHDVNNPLAVVTGQLHLMARRTEDPAFRHRITMALEAAARIRDVVARLSRLARASITDTPFPIPGTREGQRSSEDPERPRVA